jgi:hypothetical protein
MKVFAACAIFWWLFLVYRFIRELTAEALRALRREFEIKMSGYSVVVRKKTPPFDLAQDERLVTLITNYAFVLRHSKHERIFSHNLRPCGEYVFTGNPE